MDRQNGMVGSGQYWVNFRIQVGDHEKEYQCRRCHADTIADMLNVMDDVSADWEDIPEEYCDALELAN